MRKPARCGWGTSGSPIGPRVTDVQFSTISRRISAKPKVTIAKYGPLSRSDGAPIRKPKTPVQSAASSRSTGNGTAKCRVSSAVV